MINTTTIENGTKIYVNKLKATTRLIGSNEVAIQFDSLNMPTKVMNIQDLEVELGKTIHIRSNKADSPVYPVQLSTIERILKDKMQHYLDELDKTAGIGGVGGVKLRMKVIRKASEELGDCAPPSPATLARWQNAAQEEVMGIEQKIIKMKNPKRSGQYENSGIYDLALECIDDHYLITNQPTVTSAYNEFQERVSNEHPGIPIPTRQTFTKWINEICALTKLIKRNGKRYAKAFRRNAIKEIFTERPLQRVEADGLHLAVGIVDEKGNYLGRVIIFFVFDAYTRCVLGFKVVVAKAESSSAIIDSYRHALLPKNVGPLCNNTYPMYGVFESIFTDGGKGYLSKNANSFLLLAGIKQDVTQSYSGWMKPYVERFNGTVRTKFAKQLNSYCGRLGDDMSNELTIEQKATLTLPEFEALLEKWIVDEYHQTVHSKLLCTPHEAWENYFKNRFPMLPSNMEYLQLPSGETRTATISGDACHLGVQINNLRYNDPEGQLKEIGMQLKDMNQDAKVECHYSETNVFEILVINPFTGADFIAETTSNDVVDGMSLVEYKALIKARSNRSKGSVSDNSFRDINNEFNAKTNKKTKNKNVKKQTVASSSDMADNLISLAREQKKSIDLYHAKNTELETNSDNDEYGEETHGEI